MGGGENPSSRVGRTTLRLGVQAVEGDRAFKETEEITNPPATADIDWSRQVHVLEVFHQLSAQVGLGAALPYYDQDIDNNVTEIDQHASGFGDLGGYVLWTPWETPEAHAPDPFLSLHNVSLMAGLSIPTGDELEGEVPALHGYHLGSGSIETKLSLRYDGRAGADLLLFASATMTVDAGPDASNFRYGNGYDFQVGVSAGPIDRLRLLGAVDAIVREKDRLNTIELDDTGGTWWFGVLGAAVTPVDGVTIELSVAIPFYWNVNGTQPVSDEVWSAGIRYDF